MTIAVAMNLGSKGGKSKMQKSKLRTGVSIMSIHA